MKEETKIAIGHIAAAATIFVWGTTFVSTKILLRDFTPLEILVFRFLIGIVSLAVLYPKRFRWQKRQEIYFALAGLCGITLYFLFENIALSFTSASNVGVIISVAPLFTVLFAKIANPKVKLHMGFFAGFVAALCGIFLLSFGGNNVAINPKGDILAFLAAVVWGIYSILVQKINTFKHNPIQSTRRIFMYGMLFMIPALFVFPFEWNLQRFSQPVYLLNMLYLGVGASALCFVTWNMAVSVLGPIKTSVYIYGAPVVTVITSFFILGEKLTLLSVAGIALTLLGLVLSEKRGIKMKQLTHSVERNKKQ